MKAESGAALAIVLVTVAAVLVLAASISVIVLGNIRVVETAARGEEGVALAQSGVEYAVARLAVEPAWRPIGPQTVAWEGGTVTVEVAVETPPARLRLVGRGAERVVEARVLVDAPCLLAIRAETEVRIDSGVTVAGPVSGEPVWIAPGGDPPPTVEAVVSPADAPSVRPLPVTEMTAAATRTLTDALYDGATFKDEVVVLSREDPADTTPFTLRDAVLDGASVLVIGDLVVAGGFEGKPRAGFPLVVATGRITVAPGIEEREAEGVVAAGGDIEIQGRFRLRGYVQGSTVNLAGSGDAPVDIEATPGIEAAGYEARVQRFGRRTS